MEKNSIPSGSLIYKALAEIAGTARGVVFSGLPGSGKSLYVNQFKHIAQRAGRAVTTIQWDIARKAFETPEVLNRFPMGEGIVHNGIKLCVGKWLMDVVQKWLAEHTDRRYMLLIEAPLVGHRFVELAQRQSNATVEDFLAGDATQFIVPIPSKTVREKIEADRRRQVPDAAKTWAGAKPSVMTMIWKSACHVAGRLGYRISETKNPPYDPKIYQYVFQRVLKHRHFIPLHVDEVFPITFKSERQLHAANSLTADRYAVKHCFEAIVRSFPKDYQIDNIVTSWYLT